MMAAHCSSPVVYRQGATELEIAATYGRTDYEVQDDYGLTVGATSMDFLIPAEVLELVPKPGDVIVADGRRYEVMDLGSENCWRWSDPYRTTLRIHTKDTGYDE